MARRTYHGATRGAFAALASDIEKHFEGQIDRAARLGHDAVEDAVLHGEDRMREVIESSVTQTGLDRANAGGHPGRVDSGAMLDAVGSNITGTDPDTVIGEWGWVNGLENYFLFQDQGDEEFNVRFKGMQALRQSYVEARERFLANLSDAGFEVS
ncbi:hypothetical protein [Streptomyces sp. AC495_CC817]|uniref:hypothetical protein n=1 Tax=Streptomyces sp. AC495_CC817 TaxID=2823900 RepID=UPI001C26404D|nr:hypothetical protein [Streptomyces sp. AC495_CC817]